MMRACASPSVIVTSVTRPRALAVIEEILRPEVSAVEAFEDESGVILFPQEEAAVSRAVDVRRKEFATGRACARAALTRLGIPAGPIERGERGSPQWPPNIVGSITHCSGYRAAAVASVVDIITLGVDAEPNEPLPDGVLDVIALPEEMASLPKLSAARPDLCWDRLLFSAKESVYKAWFPLTHRWLDFSEALISVGPDAGTFSALLLTPGPSVGHRQLDRFTGRWLVRDGLLLTAIATPAQR
jgi:4'-phosphopantetheinyl transferase EntD